MKSTFTHRKIIHGLLISVLLAGAATVGAETGTARDKAFEGFSMDGTKQSPKRQHGGHPMKKVLQQLDLTEAQRQEIRTHMQSGKGERQAMHQQMMQLRKRMHQAVIDGADEQKLSAIADEMGRFAAQKALKKAQKHQMIRRVLTAEQRQQFDKLHDQHMQARQARKQQKRQSPKER